jgi:hypothetical protein|nr:MAG TPA: hypothetical protein [Caudoviricetes sp.]
MAIKLFDLIDSMWDDGKWEKISESDKRTHYFMIQRFMSIMYIDETSRMNLEQINYARVVDFWREVMKRRYKSKPQFLFTKTKKLEKEKEKKITVDEQVISFYMKHNELDRRDFDMLFKMFPDALNDELKMYERNM